MGQLDAVSSVMGRRRSASREVLMGMLASAGSVAVVTAVLGLLRPYLPVLILGVFYFFAVMAIAVFFGVQ